MWVIGRHDLGVFFFFCKPSPFLVISWCFCDNLLRCYKHGLGRVSSLQCIPHTFPIDCVNRTINLTSVPRKFSFCSGDLAMFRNCFLLTTPRIPIASYNIATSVGSVHRAARPQSGLFYTIHPDVGPSFFTSSSPGPSNTSGRNCGGRGQMW